MVSGLGDASHAAQHSCFDVLGSGWHRPSHSGMTNASADRVPSAAVRASAMANMCTTGNPTSRSLTPIAQSQELGIPDGVAREAQMGGQIDREVLGTEVCHWL